MRVSFICRRERPGHLTIAAACFIGLFLTLSSCSDTGTEPHQDRPDAELVDNLILLDGTGWEVDSVNDSVLTIAFSGEVPEIQAGDFLISSEGEGMLCEVVSVEATLGAPTGFLSILKKHAFLPQIIINCDVEAETTFSFSHEVDLPLNGNVQGVDLSVTVSGILTVEGSLGFSLFISENTPQEFSVELEGDAAFTEAILQGDIAGSVALFEWEDNLVDIPLGHFYIPIWVEPPVAIPVTLACELRYSVNAGASAGITMSCPLSAGAALTVGVEYMRQRSPRWTLLREAETTVSVGSPQWNGQAELTLAAGLQPAIAFRLFGRGPEAYFYVDRSYWGKLEIDPLCWEIGSSTAAGVGFQIPWLDPFQRVVKDLGSTRKRSCDSLVLEVEFQDTMDRGGSAPVVVRAGVRGGLTEEIEYQRDIHIAMTAVGGTVAPSDGETDGDGYFNSTAYLDEMADCIDLTINASHWSGLTADTVVSACAEQVDSVLVLEVSFPTIADYEAPLPLSVRAGIRVGENPDVEYQPGVTVTVSPTGGTVTPSQDQTDDQGYFTAEAYLVEPAECIALYIDGSHPSGLTSATMASACRTTAGEGLVIEADMPAVLEYEDPAPLTVRVGVRDSEGNVEYQGGIYIAMAPLGGMVDPWEGYTDSGGYFEAEAQLYPPFECLTVTVMAVHPDGMYGQVDVVGCEDIGPQTWLLLWGISGRRSFTYSNKPYDTAGVITMEDELFVGFNAGLPGPSAHFTVRDFSSVALWEPVECRMYVGYGVNDYAYSPFRFQSECPILRTYVCFTNIDLPGPGDLVGKVSGFFTGSMGTIYYPSEPPWAAVNILNASFDDITIGEAADLSELRTEWPAPAGLVGPAASEAPSRHNRTP